MPGSIARTVAAGSLLASIFCTALAPLPLAVARDDLSGGAPQVADDDSRQVGNALDTPATLCFEDSLQRITGHFREIMIAGIDHPPKNNKAASALYGQHADPAGSATQLGTGNIAVNNATIKTGPVSAGMTFATDGCNWGISEHNGDTYPNTWSDPLCSGGNKTGNADSRVLYAQGRLNGSATDNASVLMAASGGSPHSHW